MTYRISKVCREFQKTGRSIFNRKLLETRLINRDAACPENVNFVFVTIHTKYPVTQLRVTNPRD
ncbi:hypothetical protein D3C74_433180 [compost metagenome]